MLLNLDNNTCYWRATYRCITKEFEGLKLKDLKAKNYLFQAIDRSILETILSKETSKDIWDSMKKNVKAFLE